MHYASMHVRGPDLERLLGAAGAEPATWPLPLTREGLAHAAKEPVVQPMPTNLINNNKRSADEVKPPVSVEPLHASCFLNATSALRRC